MVTNLESNFSPCLKCFLEIVFIILHPDKPGMSLLSFLAFLNGTGNLQRSDNNDASHQDPTPYCVHTITLILHSSTHPLLLKLIMELSVLFLLLFTLLGQQRNLYHAFGSLKIVNLLTGHTSDRQCIFRSSLS